MNFIEGLLDFIAAIGRVFLAFLSGTGRLAIFTGAGVMHCVRPPFYGRLIGRQMLETSVVSGTGEGRHTTVRRELIVLEGGALVIDNPGMREFGILGSESGIDGGVSDIIGFAAGCRYRNCSHTGEPGCAVLEAVSSGALSREHYDNYLKLRGESEFHEMSYAEKRNKDRDFGKYLKSAKEDLDQ